MDIFLVVMDMGDGCTFSCTEVFGVYTDIDLCFSRVNELIKENGGRFEYWSDSEWWVNGNTVIRISEQKLNTGFSL